MADIREKFIEYVKASNAAIEAANKEVEKQASVAAEIEKMIPDVVSTLVKHERIDPRSSEKCAALLKDPVQVLKILTKAADVSNTVRNLAPVGRPAESRGNKTASSDGNGRRRSMAIDARERESDTEADEAWLRHFRR